MLKEERARRGGWPEPERPGIVEGYGIRADEAGLLPWGYVDERITASRN